MEWISIEDCLPKADRYILVYLSDEEICGGPIAFGRWDGAEYWSGHTTIGSSWIGGSKVISHWMPLPDPPEQDELSEILDVLSDLEAYQEAIAQQMAGQISEGITNVLSGHVKEIVAAAIKEAVK